MSISKHRSNDKDKDNVFTLKSKLNEVCSFFLISNFLFEIVFFQLERQLNEYKHKFEELRRAKTTKLIKFEKEYFDSTRKEKFVRKSFGKISFSTIFN